MENDKVEIEVLDELNKDACMGIDAINYVLEKVEDDNLKTELERQYREYSEISEEIERLYSEYNPKKDDPHKTNVINKAMTWSGIEMKTLMDNSTSKIAELLLQGTNMGIIEGKKLLNNKDTDPKVSSVVEKYIAMQEKAVEKLKEFL